MIFEFDSLPPRNRYKLLSSVVVPRPIAWVSTVSRDGIANAAPFAFFNVFGDTPPVIAIGIHDSAAGQSDTGRNIRDTGEFVVNMAGEGRLAEVDLTAIAFPPEVDEFVEAGLTKLPSLRIAAPRIGESPASLECRLFKAVELGESRWLAVGEVLLLHIADEAVLDAEACYIDTSRLQLIARAEGGAYVRVGQRLAVPA